MEMASVLTNKRRGLFHVLYLIKREEVTNVYLLERYEKRTRRDGRNTTWKTVKTRDTRETRAFRVRTDDPGVFGTKRFLSDENICTSKVVDSNVRLFCPSISLYRETETFHRKRTAV